MKNTETVLDDEQFNPEVKVIFKLGFRERQRLQQLAAQQELNLEELMQDTVKKLLVDADKAVT